MQPSMNTPNRIECNTTERNYWHLVVMINYAIVCLPYQRKCNDVQPAKFRLDANGRLKIFTSGQRAIIVDWFRR